MSTVVNLDKKITARLKAASRKLYGQKFSTYEQVEVPLSVIKSRYAEGDESVLSLTPLELRPLPNLTGRPLEDLKRSRLFRLANPLYNKATKKMQLSFAGADAKCFRFERVPEGATISAINIKFGECTDILWKGDVSYYGGLSPYDWREADRNTFIVSDSSKADEDGLGMCVDSEVDEHFDMSEGLFRMSSQNYSGEVVSKARPHNDEVIVHRWPGAEKGPKFDLTEPNRRRNLAYKGGDLDIPPHNPRIFELRDMGTIRRQRSWLARRHQQRHPFEKPPVRHGFCEKKYKTLLKAGYCRYEKSIPTDVLAVRHDEGKLLSLYARAHIPTELAIAYTCTMKLME